MSRLAFRGARIPLESALETPPSLAIEPSGRAALTTLLDASPLAIAVLDLEGIVRSWNAAAEAMFGWTVGDMVGRPYPLLQPLSRLKLRPGQFDPLLVEALNEISIPQTAYVPRRVTVNDLRSGMVLDQDVRNESGLLMIARGHEVTLPVLIRLKSLFSAGAIGGPLRVLARAD